MDKLKLCIALLRLYTVEVNPKSRKSAMPFLVIRFINSLHMVYAPLKELCDIYKRNKTTLRMAVAVALEIIELLP